MKRLPFLDHARGLIIAFVALQHATQTYAWYWGGEKYFVVEDINRRLPIFDGLFMWTDSFIIQALFFIAGMFVIPSFARHGMLDFWKQKAIRIIIPWGLAVLFLAPMLSFIKYIQTDDPLAGYFDYWMNEHFANRVPQAGYWFLSYLMLLTLCAVLIYRMLPLLFTWLGQFIHWWFKRPIVGTLVICLLSALIITMTDILYGTPYWSRFLTFFVARSNMLWTYVLFFVLGLGARASGILDDEEKLNSFGKSWKIWFTGMIILSIPYVWYCSTYIERGAITDDILIAFYQLPSYADAWPVIMHYLPFILPRTVMHGFLLVFQMIAILSILCRFTNASPSPYWVSLGACSYGIYFFHEHLCVFMQYAVVGIMIPVIIKWVIALLAGLLGAWALTIGLRRLPILDRVF